MGLWRRTGERSYKGQLVDMLSLRSRTGRCAEGGYLLYFTHQNMSELRKAIKTGEKEGVSPIRSDAVARLLVSLLT